MMKSFRFAALSILLMAPALTAFATKAEHVIIDSYADFAKGTGRSVSISDDGFLSPSPDLSKQADLGSVQIWSILPETDHSFLVGTSPDGKLFRVQAGKSEVVTKFEESQVYALAKNSQGEIFAATSPDGKIYRLEANGKSTVYFDPKEKYIWSLLFDRKGNLYAGTGINGRIYKITGVNKGEIYYQSDEVHFRSLAFDHEGRLLAGSSDSGYLYRISGANEGTVLFNTGKQEVNNILVGTDGVIYFSALGTSKVKTPASKSASLTTTPTHLPSTSTTPPSGSDPDTSKSSPITAASLILNAAKLTQTPPSISSHLYRMDESLFATEIWSSKDSILTLNQANNKIYAGMSGDGYFYEITSRGKATRLLKMDGDGISAAAKLAGNNFILASSNPGVLFRVENSPHVPGIYQSDIIDSSLFARWGAITLKAKGTVRVKTRSGNTPEPDKSWYDWTPLSNGISGGKVESLPARYLQVQLELMNDSLVDRLEIYYLPKNLPPHIEDIQILPVGTGYTLIPPTPQPLQSKSLDQILNATSKDTETAVHPSVRYQPVESRSLRAAAWKASDPNNDELTYSVFYRNEETSEWRLMVKDLKETLFSWDTSGWPDGNYYLKIVASDSTDNPSEEALTDELVSKMFTVNNTPPTIKIISSFNGKATFTVSAEMDHLNSVSISKNGKDFKSIRPIGGILDEKFERFETPLAPKEVLFIRAEDDNGNVSSAMVQGS